MRSIVFGSRRPGLVSRFGLLCLLFLLPGCGPGEGKVSGQVKYGGAPLPGGVVMFRPADPKQNSVSVVLDEQGQYQAVLPAGEVQVSVDNRALQPHEPPFRGMPPGLPGGIAQKMAEAKAKNPPAPKAEGGTSPRTAEKTTGKYVEIPKRTASAYFWMILAIWEDFRFGRVDRKSFSVWQPVPGHTEDEPWLSCPA